MPAYDPNGCSQPPTGGMEELVPPCEHRPLGGESMSTQTGTVPVTVETLIRAETDLYSGRGDA